MLLSVHHTSFGNKDLTLALIIKNIQYCMQLLHITSHPPSSAQTEWVKGLRGTVAGFQQHKSQQLTAFTLWLLLHYLLGVQ